MNHVTIPFATLLFVVVAGCSSPTDKPESPVSSLAELQARMSELRALHGEVRLHAHTEADDSEFFRWGNLDWSAPTDFVLALREDSTGAFAGLYALRGTSLAHIRADSMQTQEEVDPYGDPIPNHFTQMLVPAMLRDTAWFAVWSQDSTLETRVEDGAFWVTIHGVYDSTDTDYHRETHARETWVFDAWTGVPLRHRDVWYRGDLAYGRDLTVAFDWESVNVDAVRLAVADWAAPVWSASPPPPPAISGEDGEDGQDGDGGDDDWFENAMAALPAIGAAAPPLRGVNLEGDPVALADHIGELVYLDFWYIGCGPCMQALPHLAQLQEKYGEQGFSVVAANPQQTAPVIQRYLNRRGLSVPQLVLDSVPKSDWPIAAYPTWFLLDRAGQVVERNMGFGGEESVAYLDSLIQANL